MTRLFVVCLLAVGAAVVVPAGGAGGQDRELVERGRELYLEGCSSCHGAEGAGTGRGPSLAGAGEAAAFYYLSTGRMPLANHTEQPRRKAPAYDDEAIDALVAYVATLGDGPALPDLDLEGADLAEGGELYRDNCQPCHSASGAGGPLSYGRAAPQLGPASPLEVAAAVRVGPGQMPVFGPDVLDDEEVADVAAYVEYLDDPADPGGLPLGRTGPVAEGFVAWFLGMAVLLGAVAWIGTRARPS
jgi:ubiquinol-cytochrome c reductase cytochrome c subunit